MKLTLTTTHMARKWLPGLLAASSVAGCTTATAPTVATGFDAGGPSTHVAQAYEVLTSAAASTSTLGGSALSVSFASAISGANFSVVSVSGALTHDTGRLEINDGTFLFVDADGISPLDEIDNGSGATGTIGGDFTGTYQYVMPYTLTYTVGSTVYAVAGVGGLIANGADMPSGGNASYTGEANVIQRPVSGGSSYTYNGGTSTVAVDFAAGTAGVTLGGFSNVTSNGTPVAASAAPFDSVTGTGLVISGAQFTGGNWVTLKGGVVVNVTGASSTATSNGTFFGFDSSISAPDEVGGVFLIEGGTAVVTGAYIAD